jgi:uncharacterized RDD family membrane protein YckC
MSQGIIESEETLIIETPERVQLEFALASIGNRFLACMVDHLIQIFAVVLVLVAVGSILSLGSSTPSASTIEKEAADLPKWVIAIMIIVIFLLFTSYFAFFEWLWNGQTPGKKLLRLRVIREDGRPITLWETIARNLLRLFDIMPLPFYSIGFITVFLSSRDQRIGDLFAGTVVVRERIDEAPTFDDVFANPTADSAFRRLQVQTSFTADLSVLAEKEIEVVETFLRRRWDLPEKQRLWMAWRVAIPIMFKLKPTYDAATFTYEGFLEELIHRVYSRSRFVN